MRVQNTLARVVAGHAVQHDTHSSGILKHLHWLPIEHCIHFKLATLTHNTLCSIQPAYLHSLLNYHTPTRSLRSANTNLLSVPCVRTTFGSHGFSVAAPLCGTSSHLAFATVPLPIPSTAFIKLTASSRLLAPPSGSPKCLRFGLWLTMCTLNIDLLTYLLSYLLTYLPWTATLCPWTALSISALTAPSVWNSLSYISLFHQ